MILQKIIFPESPEMEKSLYYRADSENVSEHDNAVVLAQRGVLDLTTYFNSFSAGKWRKYTRVERLDFVLDFCGHVSVNVYHKKTIGETVVSERIRRIELKSGERMRQRVSLGKVPDGGIIGIVLKSKQAGTVIYGGAYETLDGLETNDINIGIGICTFKREAYVERNMNLLRRSILDNNKALSHGHYTVCISDNAQTLSEEVFKHPDIQVVPNKNLGGVGGFTRTMIEHLGSGRPCSHILLMDDDAMISAASLERNYTFLTLLKPEYMDYVLGGALIRLDRPTIQYESGARWNQGDIEALKADYDLGTVIDVVQNEVEEKIEYVGWWYSCIPVSQIKEKKLPLPLFLHRDDIEFGLRAKGFIMLNGICVWHEAFQNKMPGAVEYYDIRNLGIINAVHYPQYSKNAFKKELFISVSSNIGKYRYKYVSLNLMGAVDFLRGFEWFYKTDTLELHKKLGKYNYTSRPIEAYRGYGGLTDEDMANYMEEEAVPSLPVRLFRILSMNGTFFPAKKGKPKVVIPWPNIYELYRRDTVIYVDNNGRGAGVKRSRRNLVRAYIQLFRVFWLVDKRFDKVCREYRENYDKLISSEFWKRYLELEVKE